MSDSINSPKNSGGISKVLLGAGSALAIAGGLFAVTAWRFFKLLVCADKKEKKKPDSTWSKWFELKHTKINHPRYKHDDEYQNTKAWCEAQDMDDWYIESRDGLTLHAYYFPAKTPKRIVLLSHGYRGTSFGSIAHMVEFLHENDCSLLFIDQRCCGKSEGKYITFGAKEQYDVLDWIKILHNENIDNLPIYLYGQSMGASTILLASGHEMIPEVKGLIADCGFSSMKQQLRDIASAWFHIPRIELLLFRVDMFCYLTAGFRMKESDVTNALKNNKLPVLFFHGSEDTYVFPISTEKNYKACTAPKEMVLVPGARHLCSSYEAPELYQSKLKEFFEKYDR